MAVIKVVLFYTGTNGSYKNGFVLHGLKYYWYVSIHQLAGFFMMGMIDHFCMVCINLM